MPSLTLKNIPDDLYEQLKEKARQNRRSINDEIINCIERTLKSRRPTPDEIIHNARRLRGSIGINAVTDEEINRAKEERRMRP